MSNTKLAYVSNAHGSYGARIFVPYENAWEADVILKHISIWQGMDKDTGKAKGWEFSEDGLRDAIKCLENASWKVVPVNAYNESEVW